MPQEVGILEKTGAEQRNVKNRVSVAVATTSQAHDFKIKTAHLKETFELFDCIVTGDEV